MDEKDRNILSLLQADGSLSYAAIGRAIELSVSAVNERIRKLERAGVIAGYAARIAPKAVDLGLCAFVLVLLDDPGVEAAFRQAMAETDQVLECHHVTGDYSYLLKIRARDPGDLETVLLEKVKAIPGVRRTLSMLALSTPKETAALPLAIAEPTAI
ncbi:MAG: Lrp/AsnC family transcriptional regulator [Alphaproteobacteria bacterium]|jgi:Lrp/AsnC family leucine-responsive transcriptional regulator|nr:Lrp/AsnC family transcriptional regulator [Alphaproteobacteria bacterium]MDP6812380.1 Lrp/AsnC family transcriptional regulator [Alphaproteobacteria bacterium]